MDESFVELETHIAFPGTQLNPEVIPIIARLSSKLEKLEVKFSNVKKETQLEKVEQVFLSLNSLKSLTSLHIDHLDDYHSSALKFIGRACPLLTSLKVHFDLKDCRLRISHILAIIVGELVDQLVPPSDWNKSEESEDDDSMYEDEEEEQNQDEPIWMAAKSFQRIWLPTQYLTPICYTLRHLGLMRNACWSEYGKPKYDAMAAFALRHLPQLEQLDGMQTSSAIRILCGYKGVELEGVTKDSEKACEDAAGRMDASYRMDLKERPKLPFRHPMAAEPGTF